MTFAEFLSESKLVDKQFHFDIKLYGCKPSIMLQQEMQSVFVSTFFEMREADIQHLPGILKTDVGHSEIFMEWEHAENTGYVEFYTGTVDLYCEIDKFYKLINSQIVQTCHDEAHALSYLHNRPADIDFNYDVSRTHGSVEDLVQDALAGGLDY